MLNIEFYPDAWSDYLELIKDKKDRQGFKLSSQMDSHLNKIR